LTLIFESFSHVKIGISFGSSNATPDWELSFEVGCDASNFAFRAVIEQRRDNKAYGIYYTS